MHLATVRGTAAKKLEPQVAIVAVGQPLTGKLGRNTAYAVVEGTPVGTSARVLYRLPTSDLAELLERVSDEDQRRLEEYLTTEPVCENWKPPQHEREQQDNASNTPLPLTLRSSQGKELLEPSSPLPLADMRKRGKHAKRKQPEPASPASTAAAGKVSKSQPSPVKLSALGDTATGAGNTGSTDMETETGPGNPSPPAVQVDAPAAVRQDTALSHIGQQTDAR
jgi:hypothetical protein